MLFKLNLFLFLDLLTVEPHTPTPEPVKYDKKDGQWYAHDGVDVKDTQSRKGIKYCKCKTLLRWREIYHKVCGKSPSLIKLLFFVLVGIFTATGFKAGVYLDAKQNKAL